MLSIQKVNICLYYNQEFKQELNNHIIIPMLICTVVSSDLYYYSELLSIEQSLKKLAHISIPGAGD